MVAHGGILSDLFDTTSNLVGFLSMNDTSSDNNKDDSSPTKHTTNHIESYDYLQRMVLVTDPTTSDTITTSLGDLATEISPSSSSMEEMRRTVDDKCNTSSIHEMVEQRVNRIISSEQSTQSTTRSNNIHHPTTMRAVRSNQSFDQFSLLTPQHLSFKNKITTPTKMTTTKSSTRPPSMDSNDVVKSQSIHDDLTQQLTPLRANPSDDWKKTIDAPSTTVDDHPDSSKVACYKKYESILQCLNGRSGSCSSTLETSDIENSFVDLWELRELAISKGGLLCPSLRKRAWPILCNSHVDVMLTNYHRYVPNQQDGTTTGITSVSAIAPSNVVISQSDRHALTSDIKYKFKKYETSNNSDCSVSNGISTLSSSSSIASDDGDDDEIILPTMSSDENRHIVVDDDGTSANYSNLRTNVSIKSLYQKSERKVKKRTLFNIISTVLQQKPYSATSDTVPNTIQTHEQKDVQTTDSIDWSNHSPVRTGPDTPPRARCNSSGSSSTSCDGSDGSSQIDDHSFHHYDGLVDLTDVLLSNLDSPSLTTLILTKLANYHLRDAFRMTSATSVDRILTASPIALDTGVMLLFVPLLRSLDYGLYKEVIVTACQKYHPDGLASGIQTLCSIIAKHTSTWFCTAFCDTRIDSSPEERNDAASRLVDVCLVSHPLFPLYVAISILAIRKERNSGHLCRWDSREDLLGQFAKLFYLNTMPTMSTSNTHHLSVSTPILEIVEEVISMSLRYMKQVPPETLLVKANISSVTKTKRLGPSLRHISCLHTIQPPTWCLAARTPTECTLVMQRGRLDTHDFGESDQAVDKSRYPKAFTACGLNQVPPSCAYHHIRQVGSPKTSLRRVSSFQSLRSAAKTVRFQDETILRFPSRQVFSRIAVVILIALLLANGLLSGINFSIASCLTNPSLTSDSTTMKSMASVVNHRFPTLRNQTVNTDIEKQAAWCTNATIYSQLFGDFAVLPASKFLSVPSSLTLKPIPTFDKMLQPSGTSQSAFKHYLSGRLGHDESAVIVRKGGDLSRAVDRFTVKNSTKSTSNVIAPRLDQQSVSSYPGGMILDLIKSIFYFSFLRKIGLLLYLNNYLNYPGSNDVSSKSSFFVSKNDNTKNKSSNCTDANKFHLRKSDPHDTKPIGFLSQRIKSLRVQITQFTKNMTKHSISLLQLHGASRYMAIANASHIVRESSRIVNGTLNSCMDGVFDLVSKSFRHLESHLRTLFIY